MDNKDKWTSRNVSSLALSAIKDMAMRSAKVPGVASLAWGLPSFRTPEHIRRIVKQQLDADPDIGKYALPDGLHELRRIVAERHQLETGVATDPDRHVMITAGNMQGLNALFHVLIDPGDEIIMTDPGFASHTQQIRLCGGKPIHWKMHEEEGWSLDLDGLSELITVHTKAIVLVSPSNPTGKIFTETELRRLGEIAQDHDLFILLDDPYRHFTYENSEKYFNLASVSELVDRVAYLFTFSKAHAMSGWRLGYMIMPESLKRQVLKVHDATIICTPRISQVAGLAALTEQSDHLLEFEQILAERRELICERLDRVPHVFTYVKPEGAYYVFPKIVAEHDDSYKFALDLLESARVSVTPGSAFGPTGEHHVRMAYCVPKDMIDKAFDRIEKRFPV
ncbi:MAG: pyridoxal phosphate-dependent aminotransferase [Hyphomicrobiales bacterium]|nr:pyridoxal phosphate-dependent aminotransferase [Hyphomicrobiales bacterium]